MARALFGARQHDQVGDEHAVGVQVAGQELGRDARVGDEDPPRSRYRREGCAAALEDDEVGLALESKARSVRDVGDADSAGQPAAATPATDRVDAAEDRILQVVRRCVPPITRQLEQALARGPGWFDFGLGRPAAPHGDDDDIPVLREEAQRVAGHGRLADPFAGPDDADRRQVEGLQLGRVEAKVRAHVGDAVRQHPARDAKALARPEHRLVGEVDDDLGLEIGQCPLQVVEQRDAVLVVAAQLLGAPDEPRPAEVVRQGRQRVLHHRRVVLSVDDRQRAGHDRVVTSPSIRAVYFSNARVSVENWMIFSWPWNGYLRQTSTCVPETSITL